MPWPGVTLRNAILLLVTFVGPPGIDAEGNVGCLFSDKLCLEDEWCYEDLAFGRCLRSIGDVDEDDLYRYEIEREGLHELSAELRRLFALGYRWSHGYTQCRLQAMLFAIKNDMTFEPDSCSHLSDNDLEGALKALEGQVDIDPQEVAIIKYTPSVADPQSSFADEVYYPPIRNIPQEEFRQNNFGTNAIELDLPDPYAEYAVAKREWISQKNLQSRYHHPELRDRKRNYPVKPQRTDNNDFPGRDFNSENQFYTTKEMDEMYAIVKFLHEMNMTPTEIQAVVNSENYDKLKRLLERFDDEVSEERYRVAEMINEQLQAEKELEELEELNENYRTDYQTKHLLRKQPRVNKSYSNPYDENKEDISGYEDGLDILDNGDVNVDNDDTEIFRELRKQNRRSEDAKPRIYTEGGVVWTDPYEEKDVDDNNAFISNSNLNKWLGKYNLGFKRPERLDVKKPGPPFDAQISEAAQKNINYDSKLAKGDVFLPSMMKKMPLNTDNNFVHIELKNGLKSWRQGNNVLRTISLLLSVQPEIFTHGIFKPYSISFKVEQNSRGLNASFLAQKIANLKNELNEFEGIDITSVGYGDEKNAYSVPSNPSDEDDKNHVVKPSMMKKEPRGMHPHLNDFEPPKSEERDYVYVRFVNGLKAWKQGNNIIGNISSLLHLEPKELADGKVSSHSVMFRVNSRGLNASDVARKIEENREKLEKLTGIQITSVGIVDKENLQSAVAVPLNNDHQFYVVMFLVCGVLAAMIITTALLILIRRHIKQRDKLHSLNKPETECSKEFRDNAKAKTMSKGDTIPGRITSLSRESEQSPSSRSSTSSWSEEPVFHNMDISTGHMVLTYMEDHLKNKDRLEQEWVALCAYVAEPCDITITEKKENKDKNRYPDIVPYDHARVVLNELSNVSNSDYINASSITDHDPRNPAYIATQGPLPHTTPDFWQLIWEQGAVVIVMLTRLTEGGTAMCHRYWPEEGSELYHIYEVHLVSEHIWCDDYLVRSFYLKNVRTGETRTVTQFHFLSWPENGVPTSTKALLEFRRKVNKSYRGRSCPIVVHCSDGAGRTGTYCLIDMVLSRMAKGAKEIDIAATLEHLRDQRPKMVASKQQFEFVLTAVAEEVHAILKALPPQTNTNQEKDK